MALLPTIVLAGCADPGDHAAGADDPSACQGKCDAAEDDETAERAGMCLAIRGNGPRLFSHFGALARISEDLGPITTSIGGSSGSITAFLIESIQMNAAAQDCGEKECSPAATGVRRGFLFKSILGYVDALATTDEPTALASLAHLQSELEHSGVASLVDENGQLTTSVGEAQAAIESLLQSKFLRRVVNPELAAILSSPVDPTDPESVSRKEFFVTDIARGLSGTGSFAVSGPEVLVRPGIIDFETVADAVGVIGSFYAGYGASDPQQRELLEILDACAEPGRGLPWSEVAELDAGRGQTCGERFTAAVLEYQTGFVSGVSQSRVDDMVGAHTPTLVSTSVLAGAAEQTWKDARATYALGSHDYEWQLEFADTTFGYFGSTKLSDQVTANPRGFSDLKTNKARGLGPATWRTALSLSPAEPGLARALEIDDGLVSAGGWSDLFPVQALRNLDCESIIYLTSEGAEHGFQDDVARLLGMTESDRIELYDLSNVRSAFSEALSEADGVWCTDWNAPPMTDFDGLFEDGYTSPLETHTADGRFDRYAHHTQDVGRVGCTPGLPK